MSIYTGSRYAGEKTYYPNGGDKEIFGIRERKQFDLTNAKYHTWIDGDTLDFLAYKHYNNSQLWWVLLEANSQYQTELDIQAGDLIAIPPFSEVVRHL